MAHHAEHMDVDCMDSDFDNKENTFHHGNVPCTEKGYEELDVSELNMKLRYSVTPVSSPMSKSYTACPDNRYLDGDSGINCVGENANLTRSLNSTMTKNDNVVNSLKSLPLQSRRAEQFGDGNANVSVLRQLDSTITDEANVTITVIGTNDIDDNVSLLSSSSSAPHTPEAITPTKEIKEGGSPIMRGIKSVFLNMFRSSQSPVPPAEGETICIKKEEPSPSNVCVKESTEYHAVSSTPIAAHKTRDGNSSKRTSPYKDSIIFNDDLEKELNWKDDTYMLGMERIPIHKMLLQNSKSPGPDVNNLNTENNLNNTVEYMDISNNDTVIEDKTMTELPPNKFEVSAALESDSEFVDCETTFSKNESYVLDIKGVQEKLASNETRLSKNESYVLDIKSVKEKLSPCKQNLDETQNIYCSTENTQIVNSNVHTDITSVSFTDLDFKNDGNMTVPADYSDYSLCTANILSELERVEANISSEVDVNKNVNINDQTNIEQVEDHEATIATSNENNQVVKPHENESQLIEHEQDTLNTLNNANVTPLVEQKSDIKFELTVAPETVTDVIQAQASLDESISNQSQTQEKSPVEDKLKGECNINVEPSPQITNGDKNVKNIILELGSDETENVEIKSEVSTDLPVVVPENSMELPLDKSIVIQNDVELKSSLYVDQDNNCSVAIDNFKNKIISHESKDTKHIVSSQSNVMPVESKENPDVVKDNVPSEIKMQNEIILVESKDTSNIVNNYVSFKVINNVQEEIVSIETKAPSTGIDNNLPLKIVDNLNEVVPSIDLSITQNDPVIMPPIDIIIAENVVDLNTSNNIEFPISQNEKPSDIPLPDDDDIAKETVADVIPVASTEIASALTPDTLDVAVALSDYKIIQTSFDTPIIIDNKADNYSTLSFENSTSQQIIPDTEMTINELSQCGTTNEDAVREIFNVSLETDSQLHQQSLVIPPTDDLETNNATMVVEEKANDILPTSKTNEIINVSLETDSQLHQQSLLIPPTDDLKTNNATIVVEENTNDILPTSKTNEHLMAIEASLSNNVANHSTTETSGNDGYIIGNCQTISSIMDETVTEENSDNAQCDAQVEPMDITNESLNQTNDLPDLVNQTIIMTEEPNVITDTKHDQGNEAFDITNADNINKLGLLITMPQKIDCETENSLKATSKNITEPILEEKKVVDLAIIDKKQSTDTLQFDMDEQVSEGDELPPQIFTNISDSETVAEKVTVDEEILVSANNSPYVSLMSGVETLPEKVEDGFEQIENSFVTETNVASSPPIISKGYNFNFDDIDDPFATKTKIRLSPPLDSPAKQLEDENEIVKEFKIPSKPATNRRKSQPVERKRHPIKNRLSSSFDNKIESKLINKNFDKIVTQDSKDKTITVMSSEAPDSAHVTETVSNKTSESAKITQIIREDFVDNQKISVMEEVSSVHNVETISPTSENSPLANADNEPLINAVTTMSIDLKTTSSEQSVYHSTRTSSTESIQSKNVFNLPEIDDMNFNPFATKSKIRQSPPPDTDVDNSFAYSIEVKSSPKNSTIITNQLELNCTDTFDENKFTQLVKNIDKNDKMETELMEKDTFANITGTTSSSKNSDQNLTTREVNTEDEDTIEGPFLDPSDEIDKMSDFTADNDDMMQFNELRETAQGNEDNLDGEIFIDAEAFEFLLNQNKSNVVADSGKESLFLKFDPLFAKRISSDGALAKLHSAQKKQSTPTKSTQPLLRNEASPIAGPSTLNVTFENDSHISQESIEDANITVTKPTMVVIPAFNPAVTSRSKSITPTRSNRRSITFTSPAIAVIDRLLSMSANNSLLGHDTTVNQTNTELNEADLALTQLRELLAEKEISVYNLRCESKELKDRLATMETQVKNLEQDGQERLKKINELNDRLSEKTLANKRMAAVVEEYERTIASLIADIEQDKKRNAEERIKLINERDEQTTHLTSMEVSFSDLHSKYEKSKQVILTCKANEEVYKKSNKDFEEQVTKMQANYEMLKQHATAKLNHANQELEKLNKAHEAEVVKLNAMIKRNQLLATSLQEQLAQKTKANEELTAICDELINRVG